MKKAKTKPLPKNTEAADPTPTSAPSTLGEFKMVPRRQIRPDPNQPRKVFNPEKLEELATTIRLQGILSPLTVQFVKGIVVRAPDMWNTEWQALDGHAAVVFSGSEQAVKEFAEGKDDHYQIIFGERRWRAAELAGLSDIPVIVREITDRDRFIIQFTENHQRENLNAIEEADAFKAELDRRKLADPEFNATKFGEELGLSTGTVYNRLRLTRAHGPLREALLAGKVEMSVAGEVAKIPDPAEQQECLRTLTDENDPRFPWPFRAVVEHIEREYMVQLRDAPFDLKRDYETQFTDGIGETIPCPAKCTACLDRSGNMKDLFPDISNPNICTQPRCFASKTKAARTAEAEDKRKDGYEVIEQEEFDRHAHLYVSGDDTAFVGGQSRTWREMMGKRKPRPVLVQLSGSGFSEVFPREAAEAAAEKNGHEFKPLAEQFNKEAGDEDPPRVTTHSTPDRAPEPEMTDKQREKFLEEQRKKEEAYEKERAKNAATLELRLKVVGAVVPELLKKIEALAINEKNDRAFWKFLFSTREFRDEMVFYCDKQAMERRNLKSTADLILLPAPKLRSLLIEQMMLNAGNSGEHDFLFHDGTYVPPLLAACEFAGIDLKKKEKELAKPAKAKQTELPIVPAKKKKKGKK